MRTIKANDTAQHLILYDPVTGLPGLLDGRESPDTTSQYRIESRQPLPSKFQPNNLQGDDRLYLSLGDLRDSVIVPALVSDSLSTANAQAVADLLLPYFLPYLTVSTQAIQASQSLCSINDWAVDGVDNDGRRPGGRSGLRRSTNSVRRRQVQHAHDPEGQREAGCKQEQDERVGQPH